MSEFTFVLENTDPNLKQRTFYTFAGEYTTDLSKAYQFKSVTAVLGWLAMRGLPPSMKRAVRVSLLWKAEGEC